MILQYIFSIATSTNLFTTLLLFCVSVQVELAIIFCASRSCASHIVPLFLNGGGVEGRGVYNRSGQASLEVTSSITTDPRTIIEQRHTGGLFFY